MKLYSKLNVARREGLGGPYWREGPFRWGRGDACQVQLDPCNKTDVICIISKTRCQGTSSLVIPLRITRYDYSNRERT